MAMNQISINDEAKAEAWKRRAEDLNKRTQDALQGLQKDLEAVGDGAEGDLVKQFVDTAADVYKHTGEILKGMTGLLDVVTSVLSKFKEVIGKTFEDATSKIRNLFGGR